MLDPHQGTVGDLAVSADETELITFSHNAPVISRWRLDGTGPVTTRVGEGPISGEYDPTGTMLLVGHHGDVELFNDEWRGPTTTGTCSTRKPNSDRPARRRCQSRLDRFPGPTGHRLEDGTVGVYDLSTHSLVEGVNIELLDSRITIAQSSADGTRFYLGYLDGRIQTLDSVTGEEIAPVIQAPGIVGSITATTGGSRILVTSFRDQHGR